MKMVLAAFAASALLSAPTLASEPAFALRGVAGAVPAPAVTREAEPKPAAAPATAARNVRVVLASPYGN